MRMKNKGNTSISPTKATGVVLIAFVLFVSLLSNTLLATETSPTPDTPAKTPEESLRSGMKVYVMPIQGEIDEQMLFFVKRSVREARENGFEYFILDINTPGGRLDIMIDIGEYVTALKDDGITSVAFVNKDATSAGSYITLACDIIIMANGGTIGSAAPVFTDASGNRVKLEDNDEYRIKVVGYCKSKFRSMAKQKGRNPLLAEAMVDYKIALFWAKIEDQDGKTTNRIITKEEKDRIEAGDSVWDKPPQRIVEEKIIVTSSQLVNLDYKEAVKYGFADTSVDSSLDGVYKYLKLSKPEVFVAKEAIEEGLFGILNSPLLRMLLIVLGIGGIFMELKTPGFGVPGIVGGASILLLILISSIIGTANIWEIVLVFVGIVLLAVEVFVIPGFGVAGIAGLLCIFVGILLSFLPFLPFIDMPQTDWAENYLFDRIRDIIVGFTGAAVLLLVLIRLLPSTPVFRKITLAAAASTEEGFIAANTDQKTLLGKSGIAVTKLRPVGKAEFNGEQYQVVADGDFIEEGCAVEVISVNGNSITVRKAD